jgi:plasmid stabilization system protein ParE
MKLVWSQLSRTQLLEAFTYIAERNHDAAVKVYERVVERAESLLELAELGSPGRELGTRDFVVSGTRCHPSSSVRSAPERCRRDG